MYIEGKEAVLVLPLPPISRLSCKERMRRRRRETGIMTWVVRGKGWSLSSKTMKRADGDDEDIQPDEIRKEENKKMNSYLFLK
jgi:hypothetical protein